MCWYACLSIACTGQTQVMKLIKNTFKFKMERDFFQSWLSCSPFLWSHFQSLLGGVIRMDYLNRTLSFEVAFRARWIVDIILVMETLPQGIRVFFQSWLSAMTNTLSTCCPLCYQKMRTRQRKTIIHTCHKLMQFQLFCKPWVHQMLLQKDCLNRFKLFLFYFLPPDRLLVIWARITCR